MPDWVRTVRVPKQGGTVRHVLADGAPTLVWLANLNCVTPHVWTSRADRIERPDRMVFDLDPAGDGKGAFALVRRTALELRDLLRERGCASFAMTTGSRGVHVVVPLRRNHGFPAAHAAAAAIAAELAARRPRALTTEFRKAARAGRLYLDVGRTAWAMTAVPPYAVRPRARAPVAMPLAWEELEDGAVRAADAWTIRSALPRLDALGGDPWRAIARAARGLPDVG